MQVGPACYVPAPAQQITIDSQFFPYINNLVVTQQLRPNPPPFGEVVVTAEKGKPLFRMEPLSTANYMVVDVRPLATRWYTPLVLPDPTVDDVAGQSVRWTPARARVIWYEAGGIVQEVDVDINAGISLGIPPTNQVDVDLVVPDLEFADVTPVPAFWRSEEASQLRFATTVRCKVTCATSPTNNVGCLTRRVFVNDFGGAIGDVAPSQLVRIPKGANQVQIRLSQVPGVGGAPAPYTDGDVTVSFFSSLVFAGGPAGRESFPVTFADATERFAVPSPVINFTSAARPGFVDSFETAMVRIPGDVDTVLVEASNDSAVNADLVFCTDI